jgi:SHS2 domain-containing protein
LLKYEFLPHITDAYIAAYGKSLNEVFENAAEALVSLMTDIDAIQPRIEEEVQLQSNDLYSLLYAWLEHLLVKFEVDGMVFSQFNVKMVEAKGDSARLQALIRGEEFDRSRHPAKLEVKAVTYHMMEITQAPNGFVARFLLDL